MGKGFLAFAGLGTAAIVITLLVLNGQQRTETSREVATATTQLQYERAERDRKREWAKMHGEDVDAADDAERVTRIKVLEERLAVLNGRSEAGQQRLQSDIDAMDKALAEKKSASEEKP